MKKKAFKNIFCSVLCQLVTIISGLIVPRLFLQAFGSEANGLVSSLTQFLNYIALLEGGLGSVVLTALYSPLAKKDNHKLNQVLSSANKFFKQIAYVFLGYVLILGIVYPFMVKSKFSWIYIVSLTIILAIGLFIQYFFSITYKLLLQADQSMYIVQIVQIVTTIINLIIICIIIIKFPELHIVKFVSAMIFLIQPIIYSNYVKKKYYIKKSIKSDKNVLPQRWDCFGQNLAFFVHDNTDVVVLSLFCNLKLVSVYSVYFLVVSHLKSFFKSFSHAFTPLIGKAVAVNDLKEANRVLNMYEYIVMNVATIIFGCCIYLLPGFIMLYTKGVTDVSYYQPVFSAIIILAEFIYCVRDPYVSVTYAAGKFKETAHSAYIEAAINIVLSVILVMNFGLTGIAVGTLIGMTYRMVYLVWYISKNILYRPMMKSFKRLSLSVIIMLIANFTIRFIDRTGSGTILLFLKNCFLSLAIFIAVATAINLIFDRKYTIDMLKTVMSKKFKNN